MEIKQGQIWLVINDFWTSGETVRIKGRNAKVLIKKGEKIEVRYPYEWHLRTEDSLYFHIPAQKLLKNCILFGVINEETKFQNKLNLDEILEKKEYLLSSFIDNK